MVCTADRSTQDVASSVVAALSLDIAVWVAALSAEIQTVLCSLINFFAKQSSVFKILLSFLGNDDFYINLNHFQCVELFLGFLPK